jgi:RNA polymerase sigma-70 factor (ECF subfamily)
MMTESGPVVPGQHGSATDAFVSLRPLLFTVAYEMLGSAADAEDVVQETWLRWAKVTHDEVRDPRAYLVRATTRLSLNRLRTLARRRETYVGPWLPEPLLTAPDVADDVELADSVSTALLLVLETLAPIERAVFVLREVFDVDYDDIAEAVGRTPVAVRQIASRARSHVAARRPRAVADVRTRDLVLARFVAAASSGDLQGLLDVLSPDVVLITDGGGRRKAALRPVAGVEKVLRFLGAVLPERCGFDMVAINGAPGVRVTIGGSLDSVVSLLVQDGVVTALYVVRNPDKLAAVEVRTALTR